MRKDFFERFEPQAKQVPRSFSLSETEWRLIDAYRLYGTSLKGHDIPLQRLLREIVLEHLKRDREFAKNQGTWLAKLDELEKTGQGGDQ